MTTRNTTEFLASPAAQKLLLELGNTPLTRCRVCGNVTAVYRVSDDGECVCARHFGENEGEDRDLAMDIDAFILLNYYFKPDMKNPQ
jgi:hypothetical protein